MNIRTIAIATAIMGVAAVMMVLTSPVSGALSAFIGIGLDQILGPQWDIVPIFTLIPTLLTYFIYCAALAGAAVILSTFRPQNI